MLSPSTIEALQKELGTLRDQVKTVEEEKNYLYEELNNANARYEEKVKEAKAIQKTIYDMKRMLAIEGIKTEDLEDEWT